MIERYPNVVFWFLIAATLGLLFAAGVEQSHQKPIPSACSGPNSGQNSDVCADMQEDWSP